MSAEGHNTHDCTGPKTRDINVLLEEAKRKVEAMTPAERAAMMEEQRKSWVRGMTTRCEHGWLDFEQCPDCRGWR